MELYGQNSKSIPQKIIIHLIEILMLWLSYWILFQSGGAWFEKHLHIHKMKKIIVIATLKEYKNNVWVNALKKNGTPVIQTVTKNFKTGPMTITAATTSAVKLSL